MKNCFACNEPLDDDAKFCIECRAGQPEILAESKEPELTIKKATKKEVIATLAGLLQYQVIKKE